MPAMLRFRLVLGDGPFVGFAGFMVGFGALLALFLAREPSRLPPIVGEQIT